MHGETPRTHVSPHHRPPGLRIAFLMCIPNLVLEGHPVKLLPPEVNRRHACGLRRWLPVPAERSGSSSNRVGNLGPVFRLLAACSPSRLLVFRRRATVRAVEPHEGHTGRDRLPALDAV